jgi:N-acetylglucosamine-6-phosphate deacetylase
MKNYAYKTNLLVEQHFHGLFGVDFSCCSTEEVLKLSKDILKQGIGGFYPTLVTDTVDNIKRQIARIKSAKAQQTSDMAEILGIHIEGIFINPKKKGIHDDKLFLPATVENYQKIEDDFIKIVTLAPELDENCALRKYLISKGVKVQAGHCIGGELDYCTGATHLFNAMSGITHRGTSTALSALINDDIYTEIIADGVHLSDDIINLVFKTKPKDKVILVSDSLPLTKSTIKEMIFAGEHVFYDGKQATSKEGTLAGSTAVINEIVKRLSTINPDEFESYVKCASDNVYAYHNINLNGAVYWDEDFNIIDVEKH